MKTPMQELIHYIQEMQDDNFVSDIEYIKDKALSLKEKEKQVIIDAYETGEKNIDFNALHGYGKLSNSTNYYNQTFKK